MTAATLDWPELTVTRPLRRGGALRAAPVARVAVVAVPVTPTFVAAPARRGARLAPPALAVPVAAPTAMPVTGPLLRPLARPAARAVSAPKPLPTRSSLRLTSRGRLAVTLLLIGFLYVAVLTAVTALTSGSPGVDHAVTVRSGQSLSEIAATELPSLPLRRAITELQLTNAMSSTDLQAGQQLLIPTVP